MGFTNTGKKQSESNKTITEGLITHKNISFKYLKDFVDYITVSLLLRKVEKTVEECYKTIPCGGKPDNRLFTSLLSPTQKGDAATRFTLVPTP